MRPARPLVVIAALSIVLGACGDDDPAVGDDTSAADSATQDTGAADTAAETVTAGDGCGALVLIAFYSDAACTQQAGQREYDTGQACFSWTAAGSNAQDNSATRFQCYRDRLCYTQHAGTLTCADGSAEPTDKEARNGVCLKEPSGTLYSFLVSGNEGCPEAPDGFECPSSAAQAGTDGIVACGETD